MREFFGFGGFQRTPEGAYSWQHLLFVGFTIALMIGLAILFGIRNRSKDDKTKNRAIIYLSIIICLAVSVTCFEVKLALME